MARGYSLILVLIVIGVVSFATVSFLALTKSNADTTSAVIHSRRAFLVADDLCRIIGAVAQDYFAEGEHVAIDPACTGTASARQKCDFEKFLFAADRGGTNVANFTETGFTADVNIRAVAPDTSAPVRIAGGPFAGMLGKQHRLDFSVDANHTASNATARCNERVTLAPIGMFQFYVFSDIYLDFDPGGPVSAKGRIHTNGDFCVAGQPQIDTVTSAGRILISNPNSHGLCRRRATEGNNIRVATNDSFSAFLTLDRDNTDASWLTYSKTNWGKRVQDRDHGVLPLKLPVRGVRKAQAGSNVLAMESVTFPTNPSEVVPIAGAKEDNSQNIRFLVDPLLVSEGNDAKAQKFAYKADLRIIDGVWYLRDEARPEDIGFAIWSDHIGARDDGLQSYSGNQNSIMTNDIWGQEDVRLQRTWGSATPQLFTYYPFRCTGTPSTCSFARTTTQPAVISYGTLARDSTSSVFWRPGRVGVSAGPTPAAGTVVVAAANTSEPNDLLRGTRSGFKNGFMEVRSEQSSAVTADGDGLSDLESRRSRLLPINFDIAAFINALKTCSDKEVGSYFPGTCVGVGAGRVFNGIVYISSSWPGSLDGMGTTAATSGFAKLWPYQGDADGDDGVVAANGDDNLTNSVLPMPLCAPIRAATTLPVLRKADGTTAVDPTHVLRRCPDLRRDATDESNGRSAFPNIVRVINARHINPATARSYAGVTIPADVLPKGLTISTNLPLAVVGDVNVDTTPKKLVNDPLPAGDRFVPFLVATDRFERFSVAWDDANANWRDLMKNRTRNGAETTQHLEILAGWNPTPSVALSGHDHSADGFEDFPRYNERWSGATIHYFGSIVIGFASVYERTGANNASGHGGGSGYVAVYPPRDEGFDFHLEDPAVQPPGTPQLNAQSVSLWLAE